MFNVQCPHIPFIHPNSVYSVFDQVSVTYACTHNTQSCIHNVLRLNAMMCRHWHKYIKCAKLKWTNHVSEKSISRYICSLFSREFHSIFILKNLQPALLLIFCFTFTTTVLQSQPFTWLHNIRCESKSRRFSIWKLCLEMAYVIIFC